jgi:HKD family nuclease
LKTTFLRSKPVLTRLRSLLSSGQINEIDLAIAYVSESGYSEIDGTLVDFLKRKGSVRFIVGLSDVHVTQTGALRKLLRLASGREGKNLKVKYHRLKGVEFHPKVVVAKHNGKLRTVIVGSSNLTGGGQGKNVEANVAVEMEEPVDENSANFELTIKNFFKSMWESAKPLTKDVVKEYAAGETKKQNSKPSNGNVPPTSLQHFVYVDGELQKAKKFRVSCTDCREKFVDIPLNLICCDNCGESYQVNTKTPNRTELSTKRNAQFRIDGKDVISKEVDLSCIECGEHVDLADAFKFWVICEECAEERAQNRRPVCKPFKCWKRKETNNISFGLDKQRLTTVDTKQHEPLTTSNINSLHKHTRGPGKPIKTRSYYNKKISS